MLARTFAVRSTPPNAVSASVDDIIIIMPEGGRGRREVGGGPTTAPDDEPPALRQRSSDAERAYAAVAATLGSLTSDRLNSSGDPWALPGGSPPPTWHSPEPVEWLRDQAGENGLEDDEDDNYYYADAVAMEYSDEDQAEGEEEDDYDDAPDEDDEEVVENPLYRTPAPRPRRATAGHELTATQRAQTPVMSNESKNRYGQPLPVETPLHPHNLPSSSTPYAASGMTMPPASAVSLSATSTVTYRRYHDALQVFCRRRCSLMMDGLESWDPENLLKVDLEYLRTLHRIGWDIRGAPPTSSSSPTTSAESSSSAATSTSVPLQFTRPQKEGNLWSLLAHLRPLGPEAVWWQDTPDRQAEAGRFFRSLLDDPHLFEHTPRSLLAPLNRSTSKGGGSAAAAAATTSLPLLLKRRRILLRWLESCFGGLVPPRSTWPLPTSGEALYRTNDLPGTNRDKDLFATALSLVLAGRLDDAQQLARDVGTPWRSAAWGGAELHGRAFPGGANLGLATDHALSASTSSSSWVGNPHRAMWRRAMWKQAEHLNAHWTDADVAPLHKITAATAEEGALTALLGSHVFAAMSNPALRTWEKGLYATLRAVWDRTEDELLHRFHEVTRANRVTLPSSECPVQERDHLRATADIRDFSETNVVTTLAASPFPEMTSHDIATEATASVVVGQDWILGFLRSCLEREEVSHDVQALRFLTHAVLYLHGLFVVGPHPSPDVADQLEDWKDALLQAYLVHLGSRGNLSALLVLYASLLPHETVVSVVPQILASVEHPGERQLIVGQLGEYLSSVELTLLRRVVELMLEPQQEPPVVEGSGLLLSPPVSGAGNGTPTQTDVRQMKAILWLCVNPSHSESAVVFANKLLRRFLLEGKVASAVMFLEDVLPRELGGSGDDDGEVDATAMATESAEDDELMDATFADALSEHVALQAFVAVLKAVDHFGDVLDSSDTQPSLVDDAIDLARLDATEASIAKLAERRQLIREKRKTSSTVVTAANQALKNLLAILKHPGGWLLTDDEVTVGKESEKSRKIQLDALRAQFLPKAVFLWIKLCMETAAWMSLSLQDATERLGCPPESALAELDSSDAGHSPLAPGFWSAKALEIAPYVTSDQFGIRSALTDAHVKDLLSQLADGTVQHLKYTSPWSSSRSAADASDS